MSWGMRHLMAVVLLLGLCQSAHAICNPGVSRLCLQSQRFQVAVDWKDHAGHSGKGTAVPLTPDTGYFWFFDSNNIELVVKVLDGRPLNGHFWVFYGALSNVAYTLTVTDTASGKVRTYSNPAGRLASVADTSAFDVPPAEGVLASAMGPRAATEPGVSAGTGPASTGPGCTPTESTLCLNQGRFRVSAFWRDFEGNLGRGHAVSLTGDTGYFWFFAPSNVELVVKALDGRALNSSYWLFYGALSNVEYVLEVTDTVTGVQRAYRNAPGNLASFADTSAFQDTMDGVRYAAAAYDRFLEALDDRVIPHLSSPESAQLFYGIVEPAKDILRCLKRAATSTGDVSCRGFDPQTGSFGDVMVSPVEARWMASLLSLDASAMEALSGESSTQGGSRSRALSASLDSPACFFGSKETAAWYLTCEAMRSDLFKLIEGAATWACLLGGPLSKPVCYAMVATDIYLGLLNVIVCNTTPLYMNRLFILPSEEIVLGFEDSKSFEVMGNFESRPEAGSVSVLAKQTVQMVLVALGVPTSIVQEAVDPITNAVLEKIGNDNIQLSRTECATPMSSILAAADADTVTGGGVTIDGRKISSGKQEASGYIRPRVRAFAPWDSITGTSTPFKVDKKQCSGSGSHKLETFRFPASGGPEELIYTWYITMTACDGSTLWHEIHPNSIGFSYPGSELGQNPVFRCDGKWSRYSFAGSKPECEWVPENPYQCDMAVHWKTDFADGVLTSDSTSTGTGHWRDGQVITLDRFGTSRYDFSTGMFTLKWANEMTYFTSGGECLSRIADLHEVFSYYLPAEEPTCRMVSACPQ